MATNKPEMWHAPLVFMFVLGLILGSFLTYLWGLR